MKRSTTGTALKRNTQVLSDGVLVWEVVHALIVCVYAREISEYKNLRSRCSG
jgi:hypothetical protein